MLESVYADAFLYAKLSSDAALIGATALNGMAHIHKERPPQQALFPCLVLNLQAPGDVNSLNQQRQMVSLLYQVRIVGEVKGTSLQNADRTLAAAHRLDELLKGIRRESLTIGGSTLYFNTWRRSELPGRREEQGPTAEVFYRNYGGLYAVEVFSIVGN